nr:MAG TPA: hypothetical protein [Caudoviricetes sp.]
MHSNVCILTVKRLCGFFRVGAFLFFLRCTFVVLHFLPMRYTESTRRDVL